MANQNSLTDFLVNLEGTSGHALIHAVQKDKKGITTSSFFFKPYQSVSDFSIRAITPITAPVIFTLEAAAATAMALYTGLKVLYHTCAANKDAKKQQTNYFVAYAITAIVCFLAALVSPAVNFVDWIGGGINSLRGQAAEPTEQPTFAQ